MERHFKVKFKLCTFGVKTDWQILVMEPPFCASISGSSINGVGTELLTAKHWRGPDISRALSKFVSESTHISDFMVVEVTPEEALTDHYTVCKQCRLAKVSGDKRCYAGQKLFDLVPASDDSLYYTI